MGASVHTPQNRYAGLSPEAAKHVVTAAQALDRGALDLADRALANAQRHAPEHPEVLRLCAGALSLRGRHMAAVGMLQRALAQRQDDPLILNALGLSLREMGAIDDAMAAFTQACKVAPEFAPVWANFASMLFTLGYFDDARKAVEHALQLAPDYAAARHMLGNLRAASGDTEGAAAEYRRVVVRQPHAGSSWLALASLRPPALTDDDFTHLRSLLVGDALGDYDRIAVEFALAAGMESRGDYPQAFHLLAAANARIRQRVPWNARQFSERVSAMLDAFPAALEPADPQLGSEVIFVVSLPRAGSTLTEQILSAHPQIQGAGELRDLSAVIAEESQRREQAFPRWVAAMTAADWARLGRRYLERTARWRRDRPRFTDKQPSNWLLIGAALAMLPAARVVDCRRDPLETGWSCFKHMFTQHGLGFCSDLADIGAYWRDYERAVARWHAQYPARVHAQVYERLVDDAEGVTRALLEFCAVPFDAACLQFHQAQRGVATASAGQVREPLQRDTARAARYGASLDPLRAALGIEPAQT